MPNGDEPHANTWTNWTDVQSVIAVMLVIAMIIMAFALLYTDPNSDVLKVITGALITVGFSNIINFYYGSSKGSKEKDEAITTMATTAFVAGGTGPGTQSAATAAAAAAIAAPPAAAVAAPPVVDAVVPPAVEKEVARALEAQEEMNKQQGKV